VTAHGGTIAVTSPKKDGTTFTVQYLVATRKSSPGPRWLKSLRKSQDDRYRRKCPEVAGYVEQMAWMGTFDSTCGDVNTAVAALLDANLVELQDARADLRILITLWREIVRLQVTRTCRWAFRSMTWSARFVLLSSIVPSSSIRVQPTIRRGIPPVKGGPSECSGSRDRYTMGPPTTGGSINEVVGNVSRLESTVCSLWPRFSPDGTH
jgi:hypothetical protein